MSYTSRLFSLNPEEDPYRAIFEASPSGMFVLDPEGTILALNAKAAKIFGYSRLELEGRSVAVLLPPRYRNKYLKTDLMPKMQGNRVCVGVSKDGREIPLGVSFAECKTETGLKIVGVIADISQRRQLLAKYRKLAARFKLLLETSPTILYAIRMSEPPICTYVSDNIQRLLGYDGQKILKDPKFWQQNLHPEDKRRVIAESQQRCQDGAGYLEYRFRHADGSWRWIHDTFRVVQTKSGPQLLGTWTDISQRKQAEQERDRIETELRLAQKLEAVGQLAAGIAHEINTPIQFVGDSVYFLKDAFTELNRLLVCYREVLEAHLGQIPKEVQQAEEGADLAYLREEIPGAFERTLEGLERVAKIVRAMKEFGHTDQRQKSPADLNKALETTLVVARNEYKYVAEVKTEFGKLPLVECLISDLNQVFLNLIVNAAHAVADAVKGTDKKGEIRIRTYQYGEEAVIEIADTGCGIPKEIADRVFDPFFTTKEVGRGTGQGLAIARNVVDKHGGRITFESEVGKGTTFFVRLPIHARKPELRP